MRQVILYPGEDGYWVVECPSLPGCVSQGKTAEEAKENIVEAIKLWMEDALERNEPIPADIDPIIDSVEFSISGRLYDLLDAYAKKHGRTIKQLVQSWQPESGSVMQPGSANEKPDNPREAGSAKGLIWMADDFDEPLADFAEYMP